MVLRGAFRAFGGVHSLSRRLRQNPSFFERRAATPENRQKYSVLRPNEVAKNRVDLVAVERPRMPKRRSSHCPATSFHHFPVDDILDLDAAVNELLGSKRERRRAVADQAVRRLDLDLKSPGIGGTLQLRRVVA